MFSGNNAALAAGRAVRARRAVSLAPPFQLPHALRPDRLRPDFRRHPGNLADRLLPGRHAVVDFLYFYLQQRGGRVIDFPAFNVADTAICTGVALIFLITWKNEHTPKPADQ